jgi:hypothetical protein
MPNAHFIKQVSCVFPDGTCEQPNNSYFMHIIIKMCKKPKLQINTINIHINVSAEARVVQQLVV